MEIFAVFFFLFWVIIAIGGTILWIWAIIDCAMNEPSDSNEKIVWIIVVVFTHWIGALIYLIARRPQRLREHGR